MNDVSLDKYLKVFSATIAIVSFLGAIELSIYYGHFDVAIFSLVDTSEILLSFADHIITFCILCISVFLFTATSEKVNPPTQILMGEKEKKHSFLFHLTVNLFQRVISRPYRIIIPFGVVFGHFISKWTTGVPITNGRYEFVTLVLYGFLGLLVDDFFIALFKTLNIFKININFSFRYMIYLFAFGLITLGYIIYFKIESVKSTELKIYKFENFELRTSDTMQCIGRTSKWIICRNPKTRMNKIYSTDGLVSVSEKY